MATIVPQRPASAARVPSLIVIRLFRSFVPIFYQISIDRVTGHEATPDIGAAHSSINRKPPVRQFGRLRSALKRIWRSRAPTLCQTKSLAVSLDKRAISHIHCHDSHITDASLGNLGSGFGFKQAFFGRYRGLSTVTT
jgi:hypothetical protein